MEKKTETIDAPEIERIERKLSDDAERLQKEGENLDTRGETVMADGPEARDPESLLISQSEKGKPTIEGTDESEFDARLVEEGVDAADDQSRENR